MFLFFKRISLLWLLVVFVLPGKAQVSVNNSGTSPDPSAMLDVSSTNSGVLVPRMTQSQRDQIVAPQSSLLIFQTDNYPGYYFNSGNATTPVWRKLTTSNEVPVADGSETKVSAGINVWITGTGTASNPYIINSNGGGGGGPTHYIGEMYQGGIVVYVYRDDMATEHGLIASLIDLPGQNGKYSVWSNVTDYTGGGSGYDGQANTMAIISQPGHLYSAAQICDDYSNDGYSDWYLPSAFELNLVYQAGWIVNNVLYGFMDKLGGDPGYWSSTEYLNSNAVYTDFLMGPTYMSKSYYNCIRAVRKF